MSGHGLREDVVSTAWTNVVRFAMAALLALAAGLIAWWPQSAAGSGRVDLSPVAAAPTQNTPTPVHPTTSAPPPPPPSSRPTHQATHKPTPKPTHKPTPKPTHKPTPKPTHKPSPSTSTSHASTGGSGSPYVAPTHSSAPPTKAPTSTPPTHSPTAAPSPSASTEAAAPTGSPTPSETGAPDRGDQTTTAYDTYLSSSVPTQAASAPVWVVPGILLVLTSMRALLGGVLGRSSRPGLVRVRASDDDDRAADDR
jgi:hypothetical protein